jgi:hypothetical protein
MGGRGGGAGERRDIYKSTMANGGITVELSGNRPTEGYAYAPSKTTEQKIPRSEFTTRKMNAYIDRHFAELSRSGNHLGIWTQGKNVYLDVSRVGAANGRTIARAQSARQLGVFNLKTFETVNIGRIGSNGQYTKIK